MTKLNITFFLIIVGISFSLVYLSQGSKEGPKVGAQEPSVIEELADNPEKQFKRIIDYHQLRIKRRPSDYSNYNELARVYIAKARETGDLNYYIKAETLLEKSLQLNSENYSGNLYIGLIKQAKHDFKSSIQYVEKSIQVNPKENYAYGVLGDAYLEIGDLSKATEMYKRMHKIKPSLESFGRLSNLKMEKKDFDGALSEMQNAYDLGAKNSNPKENLAWAQAMIGSIYFDSGKPGQAKVHYEKSLEIMDDYYLALKKLAEFHEEENNYKEAEKLYLKVLELNSRPEVHHALSHLYEKSGKKTLAEKHSIKAKEMARDYKDLGFEELHTHSHSH